MDALISLGTYIFGQTEAVFPTAVILFIRTSATLALLPAFGEQTVPLRVRLALALALSTVLFPIVMAQMPPPLSLGLLLHETTIGLCLGAALRLFIIALQVAGSIIAQLTSLAQLFPMQGQDPQPVISHLLVISGLALAVSADLHIRIVELLLISYEMFPPNVALSTHDFSRWGLERITTAFTLGFSLAAPFAIGATLYNIALGVINRAMPQLMVMLIGAPALILGGLIMLAFISPTILDIWRQHLSRFLETPFGVAP